jgi:hypothetical protein
MIRKFLDVSTAHLSIAARELLENDGGAYLSVDPHGGREGSYGWWVWAGTETAILDCGLEHGEVPADMLAIIEYAQKRGCDWICFDCDAGEIEDLPTFDWEPPGGDATASTDGGGGLHITDSRGKP